MRCSRFDGYVLVLDGDMPPALTIARSLHRRGQRVLAASHEAHPLVGFSRSVDTVLQYPHPLEQTSDFLQWLSKQIAASDCHLIIPVTERTAVPIHQHRSVLDLSRVAIAPEAALQVALDKSKTVGLAERLGIRVPRSFEVLDRGGIEAAALKLDFPMVIKPMRSVGAGETRQVQLVVDYAFDQADLHAKSNRLLRYGGVMLQEYFAGRGIGIECIAERGRILYAFQHERMHEYPLTGGGSSLRRSVMLEPRLFRTVSTLMDALHWHGVAMVEFKYQPETDEYCLMEINGRFWGSLPLSVAAGADFPVMLYELLVDRQVREHSPPRVGVICRNLVRDLYWHEAVLRKEAPPGLAVLPRPSQVLKDLALIVSPRHNFDVQQWRDPLPGLVEIGRLLQGYFSRGADYLDTARLRRRQRVAWRKGQIAARLLNAQHLLFVCYGNINRSVVAAELARHLLPPRFDVDSAGLHPEAGRPADPTMVSVARQRGYDLSLSRSKILDCRQIERADIIFVMELRQLRQIEQLFPGAAPKVFLLGMVRDRGHEVTEIPDPYDYSLDIYKSCFDKIANCINGLAACFVMPNKRQSE